MTREAREGFGRVQQQNHMKTGEARELFFQATSRSTVNGTVSGSVLLTNKYRMIKKVVIKSGMTWDYHNECITIGRI